TLVLTDRVGGLGTIGTHTDCPVIYQPMSGGDALEPALNRFHYTEQVRTAMQVQRDYTFTHPRYNQQHTATGDQDLNNQHKDYERYDYPGRYKRDIAGKPFTKTRLTALRNDAKLAHLEGDDERLQPGLAFDLNDHPREDFNDRWRTIAIRHEGKQHTSLQEESFGSGLGTSYTLKASAIRWTSDWKAPLRPKPCIDGPQIATVVGPPGEEIYCDEWGRVKVQFPWDRSDKNNDQSSCWIRVAQGWAGATWGAMAVPRVNQELIISFLDGDPDQPIATGRTYRQTNLPPYELPKHKTRMTIKSRTHKGSGFNELRFEDELGHQEVFIHAEKDKNVHIKHNNKIFVGNDRHDEVVSNENLTVGEDRTRNVGGNERISIKGDRSESVLATSTETVALAKTVSVGGLLNVTVGLGSTEQVALDKQVQVGQQLHITATDDISVTSRRGQVHIDSSTSLILSCGGAFIKLANGRVEIGSPEPMLIHAVVETKAPARFGIPPPPTAGEIEFRLVHPDGAPMAGNAFTALLSDGTQRNGVVDQDGYARLSGVTPGCSAQVQYHCSGAKPQVSACDEIDADLKRLLTQDKPPGGQS
ncbi:type VI secretion system tip protein TssI/VgrG, partial [Pseudomonas sp.]|uniref:type VI secretion system Vgr family protein n=1 Tax=Pseudomonas sp. TaxID=306 RepID=UPI003C4B9F02